MTFTAPALSPRPNRGPIASTQPCNTSSVTSAAGDDEDHSVRPMTVSHDNLPLLLLVKVQRLRTERIMFPASSNEVPRIEGQCADHTDSQKKSNVPP